MVEMGMGVGRKGGWRRLRLVGVDGKLMGVLVAQKR